MAHEVTAERAPERICVYGGPKVGKTTLVTSLPWGSYWGEKAAYVAYDDNSETLKSVLKHNKERLLVLKPDGDPTWMREAVGLARRDWRGEGCGTLIWDTMTATAQKILTEYANSGVFSEKHAVQVGDRKDGSWHTSPMEGDYGAAQNTLALLHEHLWLQPINLIVIFHDDVAEPKSGSVDGLMGGPATVGKKAIRWIPAKYDTVLRMERIQTNPESQRVVVNTTQRGIWPAGVRGDDPNVKLPSQVTVDRDPKAFWDILVPSAKES